MDLGDVLKPLILGLVVLLDVTLMLYARQMYPSRTKRSMVKDLPSIPFAVFAWLGKRTFPVATVDESTGMMILLVAGLCVILYEIVDGFPLHPALAGVFGAIIGVLFWPVS